MISWNQWLPLLVIASSLISGGVIFVLDEKRKLARTVLNLGGAVLKVILVGLMLWGVSRGELYEVHFPLTDGLEFALHASPFSLFFVTLSAGLWLLTTIYAIGYFEDSPHLDRFFGFFSFCVCATTGIALAANLFTFVVFYEILTLTTYPLVVHSGKESALRGGRIYLIYTIVGGAVVMLAAVWLQTIVGSFEFTERGVMADVSPEQYGQLRWIFALLIAGFGVKAAMVPLHGWLPNAMVAPAPVSALLHAVAVVKAGAFGIVRVVYDVYGLEFCRQISVTTPLAIAASITIVYGSMRAIYQDDLKRRLAFSTISQVSYIVLGTAVVGPMATTGGIVHLVHQGIMKITLFFAAGNLATTLGVSKVSEMDGVGRRMPWTMTAFSVAALGMIGMPPTAGFVTKWYLGHGALETGQDWVVGVLVISTVLNAMYFLPIIYVAWFKPPKGAWAKERSAGQLETRWSLLMPPVVTGLLTVLVGLFANMPLSPLDWAKFIVDLEYGQ
ncbi:Hydrogenase-4 component B [Rubripirellula obstinata]|uniref:Hydrogenase-4 component B n=1 Tax=Rubripirellula obstinata TaxID=406547 RepID=A0A5B1CP25_9BACT|nr:monovalent cation/H+ antiporter subunit D family protein [Rubripirellula obstinata]KAA1262001.1 Hydrogenase-4 component B [Rubripirellula obstinata]